MSTTVYVVSFRSLGTGGFDFFYEREEALLSFECEKANRCLDNPDVAFEVRYVGAVNVPFDDSVRDEAQADLFTRWLDHHDDLWDFDVKWNFKEAA